MTAISLDGLRPSVVDALRYFKQSSDMQDVIAVDAEVCIVNWSPKARFHPSMMLPLVLTMAAIDERAAATYWRNVSLVDLVGAAAELDDRQKGIIVALAGAGDGSSFGDMILCWSDSFRLTGSAITINHADAAARPERAHYAVWPIKPLREMPGILKRLPAVAQIAAVTIFALYNVGDARSAFRGKRLRAMNPPAVEAFSTIRDQVGDDAHGHLLRMIAAYPGW